MGIIRRAFHATRELGPTPPRETYSVCNECRTVKINGKCAHY